MTGTTDCNLRRKAVFMAYDHGAFRVRNLENAIEFYTKKLGFKLLFLSETIGTSYQPSKPERPYCPHLCFEAEDMDEVIHTLKANNIAILDGPNEIPGSEKWIYFVDPDLNVLEYIVWLDNKKNNAH